MRRWLHCMNGTNPWQQTVKNWQGRGRDCDRRPSFQFLELQLIARKAIGFGGPDSWKKPEMLPPKTEEMKLEVRHLNQFHCYKYSLLRLKKLNHTWTAVIDTDEFETCNAPMAAEEKINKAKKGFMRKQRAVSISPWEAKCDHRTFDPGAIRIGLEDLFQEVYMCDNA
eukprot:scaffold8167_cov147-Cylindrotheca_fusiformis.AAC.1